jgi:hypothetical protein
MKTFGDVRKSVINLADGEPLKKPFIGANVILLLLVSLFLPNPSLVHAQFSTIYSNNDLFNGSSTAPVDESAFALRANAAMVVAN